MQFRLASTLLFSAASTLLAQQPDEAAPSAMQRPTLAVGTPLSAQIDDHVPLRQGQAIHARLLYEVFCENKLALPTGTYLNGVVTGLVSDRPHRLNSSLRGDFTPFRTPAVQFTSLTLPDGTNVPLATELAKQGAPIFSLVPPPPKKGGFVRQQVDAGKQMARDRLAVFTGPDKRDRLTQFLYTQLPYHPQRIEKGTAWTVETTAPTVLPDHSYPDDSAKPAAQDSVAVTEAATDEKSWVLHASLKEALSSKTTMQGDIIHAVVAEPIYNSDHTIAVPQGSVLEGAATQVKPARRFGRAGVLRFDFRQLTFPDARGTQNIQASLQGVDAMGGEKLALDSEGKLKPKPQDKVLVPLILFALATRPLDRDHGHDGSFGRDAVASNSLGLAGFLVGTAGGWHNAASGIGFYGTALSVYERWIKRGQEITFVHDTRIVVETTARRTSPLIATPR